MRKNWLFSPVFLLAIGGILMMGCTSDPDEIERLEEPDFVLEGGTYQFLFDEPRIEHGKEYQIIFTIDECDEDFVGSNLWGKICYKMDLAGNDEKVLSGWNSAFPKSVSANPGVYTWTFKAGDQHDDNVAIENPATTPDGGHQYFAFTAQTGWDNYPADASFGVNGKFEVKAIESVTSWVSAGEVTLGSGDGKGALSEEDMVRIRALPDRSKIVFTVTVTPVKDSAEPGWGVCGVGGWETNNSASITIPADATIGQQITFTAEFEIANLLLLQAEGYQIAINPYNGATVSKAELFRPGP